MIGFESLYLAESRGVAASHERMENDDRLVQVPDEDAIQIRFRIRRWIRLSPISIPAATRRTFSRNNNKILKKSLIGYV